MNRPTSLPMFLIAAACVVLYFPVSPLAAQSDQESSVLEAQHRLQISTRYQQNTWPRSAARQGLPNTLAFAGWTADPLQSAEGRLTRSFRQVGEEQAEAAFVLETWVAASAPAAQEALIDWLAGVSSDRRLPSLRELDLTIGDAGFAGPSGANPRAFAWIAFVRGNVAVRISATSPRSAAALDLAALARIVDRAAQSLPELEENAAPALPLIRSFRAARAEAVAGEVIDLEVDLVDPVSREPHLQWVIAGVGQGYVERATDGRWRLHTTGPGSLTLRLEVTASTGTFAQAAIALELADD